MPIHKPFIPPIGVTKPSGNVVTNKLNRSNQRSFSEELQEALNRTTQLTISKHAQERLRQRNITISADEWKMIEDKIAEAKKMGVKESLVLLDQAALIVSAKNQTVITVMDRLEAKSQIFTNINGTILID